MNQPAPYTDGREGAFQVVGHRWALDLLTRQLVQGRPAHAYLFTGPPNVGKGVLARWLAQALLCMPEKETDRGEEHDQERLPQHVACGTCVACQRVLAENHPDLRLLNLEQQPQQGRRTLGIEAIRELATGMAERPFMGKRKVYLIEDAECMTTEAANALLKTLEEPPSFVVLLLVALSDHLLLPTIVSRCQILPLRTLGRETVQQALQDRWGVDEKRAQLLAALSLGRLGWAVQALQNERLLQQRQEDLSSLVQLLEAGLLDRFSFAEKQDRLWKRKEHAAVFGLLEHWKSWWRDLLMIGTGCPDLITNVDYVDLLQAAAQQIGPDTVRQALKQLGDVQQRLQEQVNVRLVFEDLFLRLPAVVISTHTGS